MIRASADGQTVTGLLEATVHATKETSAIFKDHPNKLGRARMFGKKTIGLADPGMRAAQEMVQALSGNTGSESQ
jgi:dihydroxyacetone kinase-like protein